MGALQDRHSAALVIEELSLHDLENIQRYSRRAGIKIYDSFYHLSPNIYNMISLLIRCDFITAGILLFAASPRVAF
jgi:hypothetical protein